MTERMEKVTGTNRELNRIQDNVAKATDRNKGPFENGTKIKFEVEAGLQVRREHKLGRKPQGYIVTKIESEELAEAITLFMTDSSAKDIEFVLVNSTSTGDYKLEVWLY